jgi:hypothetical protein
MGRQPRLHSLSQWSLTKQTQNKTHRYQMASFPRWDPKRQHKDYQNPYIIKHIWHPNKTTGNIKIYRFTKIPHGMVKSLTAFAWGGVFTGSNGTHKKIQMILHKTQPQSEFSRTVTPPCKGVSYWLVGIWTLSGYRPSRVGEQPLRLRRDVRTFETCVCRWHRYEVTEDRSSSDPSPPFLFMLLRLYDNL